MSEERKLAPRKPGCLVRLLILLLLAGVAAGILHSFGKLQPLIDYARHLAAQRQTAPPATVPGKPAPTPATSIPSVAAKPAATTPSTSAASVTPGSTAAPTPEALKSDAAALYRARFRPPKVGAPITIELKAGGKISGTVESLDDTGIRITHENATITIERARLAPIALARCYPDEYVRYMLALDQAIQAEQRAMDEQIAKLKAEYEQQRERQLAALDKQKGGTSRPRPARSSSDDLDFKKWMEEHGESDFLKARKARIAAYEAQRIAEGREY